MYRLALCNLESFRRYPTRREHAQAHVRQQFRDRTVALIRFATADLTDLDCSGQILVMTSSASGLRGQAQPTLTHFLTHLTYSIASTLSWVSARK